MESLGIPSLTLWIVVFPAICLLYLIRKRKDLETFDVRLKMGYYLNGYKREYFFW